MNNPNAVYTGFIKGLGAAALLLLAAPGATAGTIGPDAFGYVASDATTYSFVDIAATGVAVLKGADDDKAEVNLGFTFQFYGRNFTGVCVSTNGLISLGGCNIDFANQDLTTTSPRGDLPSIAAFWTDLTFAVPGAGAVYYQTLGPPGSRQFVLQWNNAYPVNAPEGVTFQAILYESSNRILFQYKDVIAAGSLASLGGRGTVGIRDTNGQANGRRVQWSYNAPVVKNDTAVEFVIGRVVQFRLTTAANPAAGGKVTGAGLYSAGASAKVTATANPGYQFQHFSGDLTGSTNPQTLTMNGPKSVVANFAALTPLVTASVTGKTGLANARVWTLKLTNSGLGSANSAQITSLAFKQVSGTACSVAPAVLTALPVAAGTLAPSGGTATVPVTINFAGCLAAARFSVTVSFQANGGAYKGSTVINNQYQ